MTAGAPRGTGAAKRWKKGLDLFRYTYIVGGMDDLEDVFCVWRRRWRGSQEGVVVLSGCVFVCLRFNTACV